MKTFPTAPLSRRAATALFCAMLLLSGPAWAQFPGDFSKFGRGGGGFEGFENTAIEYIQSFDGDGDGLISQAEFLKAFETMFRIMDVSGDGKLDAEELRRDPARVYGERSRWAAQIIERYDVDGDGKLSASEAPFGPLAFERADANKDKFVDRHELTQFSFDLALLSDALRVADNPARVAQAFLKKYDKNNDGKIAPDEFEWGPDFFAQFDRNGNGSLDAEELGRMPGLPPSPKTQARDLIRQRDKDNDGKLSPAEFADAPERFHAADLNADGFLSLEELTAMIQQSFGKGAKEGRGRRLDVPPPPGQPMPNPGVGKPGAVAPMPVPLVPKPGAPIPLPMGAPAPGKQPVPPPMPPTTVAP